MVNSRKGNIRSKLVNYINILKTYFQIAFLNLHYQYKLVPSEYFLETTIILGTKDSLKKRKKQQKNPKRTQKTFTEKAETEANFHVLARKEELNCKFGT